MQSAYTINDLIPPAISIRKDGRYRPDFFIRHQIRELKVCTNAIKGLVHCLSVASKFTPKVKSLH